MHNFWRVIQDNRNSKEEIEVKNIVYPKCPYCHRELKASLFNNPLQSLYGEYCSDTVEIKCEHCQEKYFARFISRKIKRT